MRSDVAKDLSDSAHDFLRVVWPVIKPWCGDGDLQPVEAVAPEEFEKQLDMLAGIDAWQIIENAGIRGIASRVQWPENDEKSGEARWWETFTVRKHRTTGAKTEWEKRKDGLDGSRGFIKPALMVHAYVQPPRRRGALTYVCMCHADDLYKLATDEMEGKVWYSETNSHDGNIFAVFRVSSLRDQGVEVWDWCAKPAESRYRLTQDGLVVAEVSGPDNEAAREIYHYAHIYAENGPVVVQRRLSGVWVRVS